MSVVISAKKCILCGACVVICPSGAIQLYEGAAQVDPELCTDCLRCLCKCYARAISSADAENEKERSSYEPYIHQHPAEGI